MKDQAISVTQINNYIKSIFEAEVMLQDISVFGEISSLQIVRDVAYFSLKDENSTLLCVAFDANKKLESVKNGDQVVVRGSPNYYVKGGRLNFNVYKIEPYGQGILYLQFLRLKEKLEKEGLFDSAHKKTLPQKIDTIGVVSSETGAVIQDIINVTRRRNPNVNIVLYPAKVQGENAVKTIIEGIKFLENYQPVDVIIVARGGGSMEDLSVFNDESLARAVFDCSKYLVSAVGHETDFTIIDFVSDLRAPTPSAAAEIVTKDIIAQNENFKNFDIKLRKDINAIISKKENDLKFNEQKFVFELNKLVSNTQNKFEDLKRKLIFQMDNYLQQKEYDLSFNEAKLIKLNPKQILTLGYAKVEQFGKSIKSIADLDTQNNFDLIMADGQIEAKKV